MNPMSATWPWLKDLSNEEIDRFLADLQTALTGSHILRIIYEIDGAVANWSAVATENRQRAQDIEDLRNREAYEALKAKLAALEELNEECGDRLTTFRSFMRDCRDTRRKIDPHEAGMILGWGDNEVQESQ